MKTWSVYLLKCCDNSLYCGVTTDIDNRLSKHAHGSASKYTRSRLPVQLMASRKDLSKQEAFKLEYQIKQLPAQKKITSLKNIVL
ncbi:MAG: GIY-YIG nuclease family protein [Pseudomonadota bacterium]